MLVSKQKLRKQKVKLSSFKSSEIIYEIVGGPYHDFGYLSLISGPINLTTWSQRKILQFYELHRGSQNRDGII